MSDLAFDAWVAEARTVPIADVALERGAQLKRFGRELVGACPRCGGSDRFSVNAVESVFLCRTSKRLGDERAAGDVINLVRYLDDVGFVEACARLTGRPPPGGQRDEPPAARAAREAWAAERRARAIAQTEREAAAAAARAAKRRRRALELWGEARPIAGTLAEAYLRGRGITIALPPTLRFHPRVVHGFTGTAWPALLGAVQAGDGRLLAVHRTFLDPAGGKAPIDRNKLMIGEPEDGAVRLGPSGPRLGIAEGIETGLSALELYGVPVWCALGDHRMSQLTLPDRVRRLIVFRDDGLAGARAAEQAREVYARPRRRIGVANPPVGSDFNDVLRSELSAGASSAQTRSAAA